VSLFITYVNSTCFGPHRSIIRSVFYKLYVQIWYVVMLCVLLDTSSRYKVVGRTISTNNVIVYYNYGISMSITHPVLLIKLRNAKHNDYFSFNLAYFSKF
jgi:hypothetical protein